jgi:hypothetical protein
LGSDESQIDELTAFAFPLAHTPPAAAASLITDEMTEAQCSIERLSPAQVDNRAR